MHTLKAPSPIVEIFRKTAHHAPGKWNGATAKRNSVCLPSRHAGMHTPQAPPPIVEICQKAPPFGPGKLNGARAKKKSSSRSPPRPAGLHISKAPPPTVVIHGNPLLLAPRSVKIQPRELKRKRCSALPRPSRWHVPTKSAAVGCRTPPKTPPPGRGS